MNDTETAPSDNVVLTKVEKKGEEDVKAEVVVEENGDTEKETTENGHAEEEEAPKSEDTPQATEEPATEASADAVVPTEEPPKEEVPAKVILHQFPPAKNIPSLSPFCLKLETFLRLNKIPYENQYSYKMGKKGKMPWIEYKGDRKADSSFIVDYLNEKFEVNIDNEFSNEELATGRMVKVAIEENTVNALHYFRYLDNYNEYKKLATPPNAGLGFNVGLKMAQRKMKNCLDGHGMGRHLKEEVYAIAKQDICAVSKILGEKDFILGDKPSSYDCTLFGFLANVLLAGLESPLSAVIKEDAQNLIAYTERMKELCWADWTDMVQGEKPEPSLKKGFSFRKKKAPKVVKTKESDGEEAEATSDEAKEASPESKEETPATEENEKSAEEPKTEEKQDEDKAEETKNDESSTPTQDSTETDTVTTDKITEQPTQNGGTDATLIKSEE